jgi:catechol 2,3-dioxygenase-like lactoylglutathione lyase family enzyme
VDKHSLISEAQRSELSAARDRLRTEHLRPKVQRPTSSARGVHHLALVCSDVATTVRFYQELLEFPLTEMFENRDLAGSTHFFFDIGHGNLLAFFDLPGVQPPAYGEVLGGIHHLAISVDQQRWEKLHDKLVDAGIDVTHLDGSSLYFHDPDGVRLELISDPLLEMYGHFVG